MSRLEAAAIKSVFRFVQSPPLAPGSGERAAIKMSCVYRKLDSAENGPESVGVVGSAHAAGRS